MEDQSVFCPPAENLSQSFASFNDNEILNNYDINDEDFDDDIEEFIYLLNLPKPKNKNIKEPISSSFIKAEKLPEKNIEIKINDELKEKLKEKLKTFLLRAYKLICEDNGNDLIEMEKIDDGKDSKKDEINFINIIRKINENEKENFEMTLLESQINEKYFNIILYEKHEINMCNNLLKMEIIIKLEINMAMTSGNVEINFYSLRINYNNKSQMIKLEPNLKCLIINSIIGKKGATYCSYKC